MILIYDELLFHKLQRDKLLSYHFLLNQNIKDSIQTLAYEIPFVCLENKIT
jgi:hypothetical protein